MTVELRSEDQQLLQTVVDSGQYASLEEALHDSRVSFAPPPSGKYKRYLDEVIEEGLADAAAGRLVPAEDVIRELHARAKR
jgi:predicted transcriptional regulator